MSGNTSHDARLAAEQLLRDMPRDWSPAFRAAVLNAMKRQLTRKGVRPWPKEHESELPKFLKSSLPGRNFVMHLHSPRFIMEIKGNEGSPQWIDTCPADIQVVARLMREAGDFYAAG